jgi:hypothetical protein
MDSNESYLESSRTKSEKASKPHNASCGGAIVTCAELWNWASFDKRAAILYGLGTKTKDVEAFANQRFESLPQWLQESLNNEFKRTGVQS